MNHLLSLYNVQDDGGKRESQTRHDDFFIFHLFYFRHGSYKLVETASVGGGDQQIHAQHHQRHAQRGRPSSVVEFGSMQQHHRRSGYVNSGAETEAEVNSVISAGQRRSHHRRRHRSRSRSPAAEARHRMPAELRQHLEFGLVEPNTESMRGDIPYKSVETARPVRLRNNLVNGYQVQTSHARRM